MNFLIKNHQKGSQNGVRTRGDASAHELKQASRRTPASIREIAKRPGLRWPRPAPCLPRDPQRSRLHFIEPCNVGAGRAHGALRARALVAPTAAWALRDFTN